ncbi:hypothetical protein CG719_24000 [Streptomyces sp. CB01373]|nr:hypothetical protein CG719_24000 [Streptomyces sp. CB01373]
MNRYSVPVRLIDRTVRAMLHASELVVQYLHLPPVPDRVGGVRRASTGVQLIADRGDCIPGAASSLDGDGPDL